MTSNAAASKRLGRFGVRTEAASAFNLLKAFLSSPRGEAMGTPGLLARTFWGDATQVMRTMLLSMTPPISVQDDEAFSFVEDCITNKISDRLTEFDVRKGKLTQLYAMSYRHESPEKSKRITTSRLKKVIEVVRSHAADCGQESYSIWIDSLFSKEHADPLADWADRGLSPYAFCYVVASPSQMGFEEDLKRVWISCEHQLAFTARGVLLHLSDERPKWTLMRKERLGNAYAHIRGGSLDAIFCLRGLAIAISYGLLRDAEVTFDSDLQMLRMWSMRILCSRWKSPFSEIFRPNYAPELPCPVSAPTPIREQRLARVIHNVTNINNLGSLRWSLDWDVIGPVRIIHHEGQPRRWNTGYEVARALCGDMQLSEHDGLTQKMFAKIAKKCRAYVVLCESSIRGLVVFSWSLISDYILMDVEMTEGADGCKMVTGYSIVHSARLRSGFQDLWFSNEFDKVIEDEQCGKFLDSLTMLHYSKLGRKAIDMYRSDPSTWIMSNEWQH